MNPTPADLRSRADALKDLGLPSVAERVVEAADYIEQLEVDLAEWRNREVETHAKNIELRARVSELEEYIRRIRRVARHQYPELAALTREALPGESGPCWP